MTVEKDGLTQRTEVDPRGPWRPTPRHRRAHVVRDRDVHVVEILDLVPGVNLHDYRGAESGRDYGHSHVRREMPEHSLQHTR